MRISDWSSDVCSSDLEPHHGEAEACTLGAKAVGDRHAGTLEDHRRGRLAVPAELSLLLAEGEARRVARHEQGRDALGARPRSEEHTSELQSLMRTSNAVSCSTKKK